MQILICLRPIRLQVISIEDFSLRTYSLRTYVSFLVRWPLSFPFPNIVPFFLFFSAQIVYVCLLLFISQIHFVLFVSSLIHYDNPLLSSPLGIQMWKHDHYQSYKCHGPYVKDWGCCSASWHPSLLGHELRAAHYSYFWLLAFRDALNELSDVSDVAQKLQSVKKHIDSEHKHIPTSPLNPSDYADHLQCYTTSEPLYDETGSLFKLVIPSGDGKEGFKDAIVDDFVPPHGHITKLQK